MRTGRQGHELKWAEPGSARGPAGQRPAGQPYPFGHTGIRALRQSGKHRRTASRSGPGALPAQGHRPVLAVENASVRLARSHVHTGLPERLQRLLPWSPVQSARRLTDCIRNCVRPAPSRMQSVKSHGASWQCPRLPHRTLRRLQNRRKFNNLQEEQDFHCQFRSQFRSGLNHTVQDCLSRPRTVGERSTTRPRRPVPTAIRPEKPRRNRRPLRGWRAVGGGVRLPDAPIEPLGRRRCRTDRRSCPP